MDTSNFSDVAVLSAISGILLVVLLLWLVPTIFFLLTLQKALKRVAPERRTMNPPMVWLGLIPLFNLVWNFLMVLALSNSLGAEVAFRKLPQDGDSGKTIGLVWAGLSVACLIPGVSLLAGLPALIMWIIYWVKIAGISAKIADPGAANTM